MPERLYNTDQVASLLGTAPATIHQWIQRGWLKAERLPEGSVRVSESGLVRFLKDQGIDLQEIMARTILREAQAVRGEGSPAAPAERPAPVAEEAHGQIAGPGAPSEATSADPAPSEATAAAPAASHVEASPPEAAEVSPPSPSPNGSGPAAQLAQAVLADAVRRRATAIHLEPQPDGLALRLRIDGMLHLKSHFKPHLPAGLGPPLVAHLKELAGINMSECTRPQEGRFVLAADGRQVELRLATFPTLYGEKVVLRVVDHGAALPTLDTLGFSDDDLATVRRALAEASGLVLVMGPPRSDRRTTLRAMIAALSSPERSIVALEETIDVEIPEVAHAPAGLGRTMPRAEAVRALGAQDADILMVGEVRDRDTVRAVVEAAAEGCLVLAVAPSRSETPDPAMLLAAGVEPMMLASTLLVCIVQRSARRLCPHCKVPAKPSADLLRVLGYSGDSSGLAAYRNRGCAHCSHVGYAGRVGLFSVMRADEAIARLVLAGADARVLAEAARQAGCRGLREAALDKVRQGITSVEEAVRALGLRQ
jgi:type II secretory ATPase GspE/PulE/Tfp pilus assembly ATPase PilB-like protein